MKHHTIIITKIILVALLQFACDSEEKHDNSTILPPDNAVEEGKRVDKNFVNSYYIADSISAKQCQTRAVVKIVAKGQSYTVDRSETYKRLSEQFGDTCFYGCSYPTYEVVNNEIRDIDMIAIDAFDDNHGEGSSLSDITTVVVSSPYNYIQAGYKDKSIVSDDNSLSEFLESNGIYIQNHYEATCVKMKDFTTQNVKLFAPQIYIIFDDRPAKEGLYRFYITVNLSDKKFKEMVQMNFY